MLIRIFVFFVIILNFRGELFSGLQFAVDPRGSKDTLAILQVSPDLTFWGQEGTPPILSSGLVFSDVKYFGDGRWWPRVPLRSES